MAIEVGEHLLAAFEANIEKEDHGNGFVGEFGTLLECFDHGLAAVLAVIDDELGLHGHFKHAKLVLPGQWIEINVGVDRDG